MHDIIIVLEGTHWMELPVNQTGIRRMVRGPHQTPNSRPPLSLTHKRVARGQMVSSPSLPRISYDGRLSHNLQRNGRLRERLRGREGERCRK